MEFRSQARCFPRVAVELLILELITAPGEMKLAFKNKL
jgi:hypothetical protein